MNKCPYCGDSDCGKTMMCWRRYIREGLNTREAKPIQIKVEGNMSREREGKVDPSTLSPGTKFKEQRRWK